MQRPAFPELQGQPRSTRHRRREKPDRVLLALKVATFLAASGLIGVIVLLAGSGGSDHATPPPTAPKPGASQPGDDAPKQQPQQPQTTVPIAIAPPALRTETTNIAGKPAPPSNPPPTPAPTTQPSQPSDPIFAVRGQPCPEPGMWSVTRNYEPVVCASSPPGSQPRWYPVM